MDGLAAVGRPSCVTEAVVASLNRYLNPAHVLLLARDASACALLVTLAPNVRCLAQDEVVPGVAGLWKCSPVAL